MKKVLYWLMGEKAGRTIVGTWNWLWGIPVESGGKVSVAVAEESLRSIDKLNRERTKLEAYKTDMQNMKDMAEINEALDAIAKVNNDLQSR